jgi:hypothetical protein
MQLAFKDQLECCAAIASFLARAIHEPWLDVTVSCELDGEVVTITKTYAPVIGGNRKDIPFIPELGECFYRLAHLVSTERKGLFHVCNFTLERDGKYNANYKYSPIS